MTLGFADRDVIYVQGPVIHEPTADLDNLRLAVSLIKETLQIMQGSRGDKESFVMTVGDLLAVGLLKEDDVRNLPDARIKIYEDGAA